MGQRWIPSLIRFQDCIVNLNELVTFKMDHVDFQIRMAVLEEQIIKTRALVRKNAELLTTLNVKSGRLISNINEDKNVADRQDLA